MDIELRVRIANLTLKVVVVQVSLCLLMIAFGVMIEAPGHSRIALIAALISMGVNVAATWIE